MRYNQEADQVERPREAEQSWFRSLVSGVSQLVAGSVRQRDEVHVKSSLRAGSLDISGSMDWDNG